MKRIDDAKSDLNDKDKQLEDKMEGEFKNLKNNVIQSVKDTVHKNSEKEIADIKELQRQLDDKSANLIQKDLELDRKFDGLIEDLKNNIIRSLNELVTRNSNKQIADHSHLIKMLADCNERLGNSKGDCDKLFNDLKKVNDSLK